MLGNINIEVEWNRLPPGAFQTHPILNVLMSPVKESESSVTICLCGLVLYLPSLSLTLLYHYYLNSVYGGKTAQILHGKTVDY